MEKSTTKKRIRGGGGQVEMYVRFDIFQYNEVSAKDWADRIFNVVFAVSRPHCLKTCRIKLSLFRIRTCRDFLRGTRNNSKMNFNALLLTLKLPIMFILFLKTNQKLSRKRVQKTASSYLFSFERY